MTPKQCRAARMAVGLSEHALGKAAGFRKITVTLFETGHPTPAATCEKLRQVLEAAGIEFLATDGNTFGVMLREAAK
jgi:DNA-binding XRE family transcriptional regulator